MHLSSLKIIPSTWKSFGFCFVLLFAGLNLVGQEEINLELKQSEFHYDEAKAELDETVDLVILGDYRKARPKFTLLDSAFNIDSAPDLQLRLLKWRAYMNKVERHLDESLADYLTMLRYYEEQNNPTGLAEVHTLMAEFYRAKNQGDKAFEQLEIAEGLFENNQISNCVIAFWFSRRAACESQFKSNSNNVRFFSERGLEILQKDCDFGTRGMILNELGFMYGHLEQDNEEKIIGIYNQAIEAYEEVNRQRDIVTVKNNLANYYMRRLRYEDALEMINEAIEIGKKYHWLTALEDSYLIKMATLDYLERHEEAYRTSVDSYNSKIEQMNYQYSVAVEEIQERYEKELTEQELEEVRLEAKQSRDGFILSLIFTGILLLFTVVLVWLILRIRKSNSSLKDQQRIIKRTNKQLSETLEEKELLYKELNHRVKNNLMILSGLVYMQEQTENNEENRKLYEVLRLRIHSIALVHEKLYGMDEKAEIDFQDYLKELIALNFSNIKGGQDIKYSISCHELKVALDQAIPLALIFNELINNVKKHAKTEKQTSIQISARVTTAEVSISFKDNGPGLPKGFEVDKSQSLGMKIIHMMAQQLRAEIKFINQDHGVLFELHLDRKPNQMSA